MVAELFQVKSVLRNLIIHDFKINMEWIIIVLRAEDQLAFAWLGQAALAIFGLLVCPLEADEVQR